MFLTENIKINEKETQTNTAESCLTPDFQFFEWEIKKKIKEIRKHG